MNDREDPLRQLVEQAASEYRNLRYRGPVPVIEPKPAFGLRRALWPAMATAAALLLVLWPPAQQAPDSGSATDLPAPTAFEWRQPGPPGSLSAAARVARQGIDGAGRPELRLPPPPSLPASPRPQAG